MLPYNKLDPIPPSKCYVDAPVVRRNRVADREWDMVIVGGPREFELIPVADLPFDYLDAEGEVMTVFVSEILNIRIDYVSLGRNFYLVNHTSGWQIVVFPEDYRGLMILIHKTLRLWNYLFTDQTIRIEFTTTDQWGTVTEVWEAGNNLLRKDGEIQLTIQLSNIIRRYLWV
jgi:hypothetical protein|nr:MAG TPA: hypothetical protein [Caudoviricetes sp.]